MGKIEQFKLRLYPELPPEKPTIFFDKLNLEKIEIGSPAIEIVEGIVKSFPDIKKFMYVKYDPYRDSNIDPDNLFLFSVLDSYSIDSKDVNRENLLSISAKFAEGGDFFGSIFGLASKVTMRDGSETHIPMMDFGCPVGEEYLAKVEQMMGFIPGYILESGNSYHFWGDQLMTKNEWQDFLNYCDEKNKKLQDLFDKDESLIEENYLAACRGRGACVLRVFNFFDEDTTLVKEEPKVVKILKIRR